MALNYKKDLCHHRAHGEVNAYEFYASTFIKSENLFSFPSFHFNCYDERQFSSKALLRDGERRYGSFGSGPLSYVWRRLFIWISDERPWKRGSPGWRKFIPLIPISRKNVCFQFFYHITSNHIQFSSSSQCERDFFLVRKAVDARSMSSRSHHSL